MGEISLRIGRRIRELRSNQCMSQETLAMISGLHVSYISQIERGLKNPTVESIDKICKAMKLSFADIFSSIDKNIKDSFHNVDFASNSALEKIFYLLRSQSPEDLELLYSILQNILLFRSKNFDWNQTA